MAAAIDPPAVWDGVVVVLLNVGRCRRTAEDMGVQSGGKIEAKYVTVLQ